uniref:Uncharacterized protein n=1 Tax=Anguilla anguilla TaxID=7936 RepID=A0A0E9VMW3_ANGAN
MTDGTLVNCVKVFSPGRDISAGGQ